MRAQQRGLTPRGWGIAAAGTVVCAAGLALCLGGTSTAQAAPAAVSGGAFGVAADVTLAGVHVHVAALPAVTLPSPGGSATPITGRLAGASVGSLATLGVLDVATVGTPAGGSVQSTAEVQGLQVDGLISDGSDGNGGSGGPSPDGQENVIRTQCSATESGASASTDLAHLVIAGQTVAADPGPNTTVHVAGLADVVLNEQIPTGGSGSPGVTVNGVHIRLLPGLGALGGGDIYLAQSRCSLTGGTGMPVGAVGGVVLTGVLGVLFTGYQFRKRRSDHGAAGTGPSGDGAAA